MPPRSMLCVSSLLLLLAGCNSTPGTEPNPVQAIVEQLAQDTEGIARLTVHQLGSDEACTVLASTDGTKIGQPSDQEDLKAMQTGKPVVLEEAGACDITVPVRKRGDRWTHAVGVTLRAAPSADRKLLRAKAIEIADAIAVALADR